MHYTLSQAAKATGKDKTSIRWAVKNGRIAGVLQDEVGGYKIPADSLFKVYPPVESVDTSSPTLHPLPVPSLVKTSPLGEESTDTPKTTTDKKASKPSQKTEDFRKENKSGTPEKNSPSSKVENYLLRVSELEIKLSAALQRINDLEKDKTTWQELWRDERELWRTEVNAWQKQANALTATIAMLEEKHQQRFITRRRGIFKRWFGEDEELKEKGN